MSSTASFPIKSALILGSTSEIAKAICLELANRGCEQFHFISRNSSKNKSFIKNLKSIYSVKISEEDCDLLESASLDKEVLPSVQDFDLYLIAAGSLGNPALARSSSLEALKITTANYLGLIPWITAICTKTRLKSNLRLWVFTSVASDRGRPSNYHYGAAKSGLEKFCEGILLRSYNMPFKTRIIKAGFMATPMTIGKAPSFLCVSPKKVAKDLLRNPNKQGIEYLPWWWFLIMLIVRLLPNKFASRI